MLKMSLKVLRKKEMCILWKNMKYAWRVKMKHLHGKLQE